MEEDTYIRNLRAETVHIEEQERLAEKLGVVDEFDDFIISSVEYEKPKAVFKKVKK